MYGSNRSIVAKAGLIIAACIAALIMASIFIGYGLTQDAEYQRQADAQSREYAAYTQDQERQDCFPLAGYDKSDCIAEKRHEYRADRRNERDLVAQRKSANWAYIMGAAAVIGMVLSVVGVALVWTTFAETRKANQIALMEHRPWILIELVKATVSSNRTRSVTDPAAGTYTSNTEYSQLSPVQIVAEFTLINKGNRPAKNLTYWTKRLKGQLQVVGEPSIYGKSLSDFYFSDLDEKRKLHISALLPGESVGHTVVLVIDDEWLSDPIFPNQPRALRTLPRYAFSAIYDGEGILGRGETGKTFMFSLGDGDNVVDPFVFRENSKWEVRSSPVMAAVHIE